MVAPFVGLRRYHRGIGPEPLEPRESIVMVIYTFASSKKPGLFAFAADRSGRQLPDKHGPWKMTKRIDPDASLPHDLDRAAVEEALAGAGFQMWRLRKDS